MSDLKAFLDAQGLGQYLQTFCDEEITDVALLKSMGDEMLRESMEELGMEAAHVEKLSSALFGGDKDGDEGLSLDVAVGRRVERDLADVAGPPGGLAAIPDVELQQNLAAKGRRRDAHLRRRA